MEHFFLILLNIGRTFLARGFRKLRRNSRRLFKDHWLEVPAKIDIVSVVEYPEPSEFIKTYIGILTYFYRNPELHTGDYQAEFESEGHAWGWVNQFKGRRVIVRVNPRDLEDSVLLNLPAHSRVSFRSPVQDLIQVPPPTSVRIRALSPGQKRWVENCRLISVAGLGANLIVLVLNIAFGGHAQSPAFFFLVSLLIAFVLISLGILSRQVIVNGSVRAVPRLYALWCTRKMKRLVVISGSVLMILSLYSIDRSQFPANERAEIGVQVPYMAASWILLVCWALHDAILRSQQDVAAGHETYQRVS